VENGGCLAEQLLPQRFPDAIPGKRL